MVNPIGETMMKVQYHDPDLEAPSEARLAFGAAVASLVRLGYFAVVALVGGGLIGWGMWLDPAHAADILGGLGFLAGGGGFLWFVHRITEDER